MQVSTKSLTLATLVTTTIISNISFLSSNNQVSANVPILKQGNHQINKVFSPAPSIVGNWKGSIGSKGDDVRTVVEIDVSSQPGAIKQGSWKFWGSDVKTNKDIVLQSGTLVATVNNNNTVTLLFKQDGKKFLTFNTQLKNVKQLSGELVDKTNIQIYLEKNK
ncbi:conserved hypothetical protein [Trichormus variabilis ATCC 29413]|uniref:Uncharacterized protein n=2 Tax=Anabaena variabilis TaxID=264691 RepID=Q3MEM1_TRIV2|nr:MULTISPECIES: hypothetical protein [Nostocaceae]ABA20565.1 conserved hypothetical protein [Trichormus variabilis ATCC 29413]MBC1213988.1 hypothetical protein [Trichormus variabilis ARAD]MBC1257194.1 hypothetical protein [Trichormus variabilis V5]MBC1269925.1 hypothetical protein [Trichormus variabilis FSR]MBC1300792.1 hypothetical protein [Trichormus variabilis N2B]